MRYQNGMLRDERDSTLRISAMQKEPKLAWAEYLPPLVLIALVSGILIMGYLIG